MLTAMPLFLVILAHQKSTMATAVMTVTPTSIEKVLLEMESSVTPSTSACFTFWIHSSVCMRSVASAWVNQLERHGYEYHGLVKIPKGGKSAMGSVKMPWGRKEYHGVSLRHKVTGVEHMLATSGPSTLNAARQGYAVRNSQGGFDS